MPPKHRSGRSPKHAERHGKDEARTKRFPPKASGDVAPPSGAPHSSQASPSSVLLRSLFLCLPYLTSGTSTTLLNPILGSTPVEVNTEHVVVYPVVLGVVISFVYLSSNNGRPIPWTACWSFTALWSIASERIVRICSGWLVGQGLRRAVRWGWFLLRGPPAMLRASWRMGLVNDLKTVKGPWSALATLAGAMGIALALESSFLGSFNNRWLPYTESYPTPVPETTFTNIHSLALILIVLVPTLRRQVDPPNGLSTSSISKKLSVVLVFLTASALLTSTFSSPTCHLKPYLPSFFCSKPITTGPVRILASQQSITGRVVVGETVVHNLTLRYLRVDHSLLGGLWMMPAEQEVATGRSSRLAVNDAETELRRAESIYSIFILQELVRLARPPRTKGGVQEEKALVIGLGAGLIARSLEQYGIVTSLVEIDPVVYRYARDYYGVKNMRGEIALEDAIGFLSRKQGQETYDYIIHDVFTGGTVPPSLFTMEAWALVKSALTPDGLVAINFAGTVGSPTSHVVLSTILASFYHCIVLGDGGLTRSTSGFSNLAIFCSAQPGRKVVLRPAVASDYLEWPSPNLRRKILGNFQDSVQDLDELVPRDKMKDVLRGKKGRKRLKDLQRGSAELHWGLMNEVLPLEVWDLY